MKPIILIFTIFSLNSGHTADLVPSTDFCNSMKGWIAGSQHETGKEICEKAKEHEGFCSSASNAGQGICMTSKKHSGFCSSVKNTAMGICQALGEPSGGGFCSSQSDSDTDKWISRLKKACSI